MVLQKNQTEQIAPPDFLCDKPPNWKISRVHKLFTKQERFWNAVVSFREREVRIVVSTGRQKLPGNIIFKKAEIW
jgi:hypothetical protein